MNEDFKNREKLFHQFEQKQREVNLAAENEWDKVDIAYGIAIYDPDLDDYLKDTVNRADKNMYDNKNKAKNRSKTDGAQ